MTLNQLLLTMRRLIFIPLIGLLFFVSVSKAQTNQELATKIQGYFEKYQAEFPVEKAYLHLDKQTYTLGDDVWFGAYLVAGSNQILSPLSRTLYVDFFDSDGLLVEQRKVKLENGRGAGDFKIARFGKAGTYQIKAYTAWMTNFGQDYFFSTTFQVVDGEGGSFLPKVDFTGISSAEGKVSYQVSVFALSSTGDPLKGKSLEIRVIAGEEVLHSQPLGLNAQGQASFSFSIPEKPHPSQSLELTYLENGTYPVTKKIRLPYSLNLADIQFLPEGGHWVVGKKSNLAFRAVDPDGSPVDISGELGGQAFSTRFGGMGKVEFTPTQALYSATISNPKTAEKRSVALPEADPEGLTLQVINNPNAAFITAFVQGKHEPNSLLLVSQTRGLINYIIQGALNNGVWGVRIPRENLVSGINQITILSAEGKPLLERLVFVHTENFLDLDISSMGKLDPRAQINLDILSKHSGKPVEGIFSVSITDADQVSDESNFSGTIFSSLLLTSDLRGKIHQPGYLFKDREAETLEILDLVMLTHAWRRFSWENVLAEKLPEIKQFIERGINIEGQITEQTSTKKGLGGGKVSAFVGEGVEIIASEFGPNGRFIFTELDYQDSVAITITAEDNRVKKFVDVSIIQPEPVFSTIAGRFPEQILWPSALTASVKQRQLLQELTENQKTLDLEGVTVEGQSIKKEEEEIRKIYGSGDVTISPDKIPGNVAFTNVFQLIQGRVSGVQIFVSGLDVSVQIRGVGSINSGTTPLFLLDNMPVDAATLLQVNPRDVESVDVFKDPARAAIFGSQGANGVIAVYTKSGTGMSYQSVGGTLVTSYGGYSTPREFYTPKYENLTPENSISDQRATVYWNALVKTDTTGTARINYFNTDVAKRHLVILEGIDSQGRLGRITKIIE